MYTYELDKTLSIDSFLNSLTSPHQRTPLPRTESNSVSQRNEISALITRIGIESLFEYVNEIIAGQESIEDAHKLVAELYRHLWDKQSGDIKPVFNLPYNFASPSDLYQSLVEVISYCQRNMVKLSSDHRNVDFLWHTYNTLAEAWVAMQIDSHIPEFGVEFTPYEVDRYGDRKVSIYSGYDLVINLQSSGLPVGVDIKTADSYVRSQIVLAGLVHEIPRSVVVTSDRTRGHVHGFTSFKSPYLLINSGRIKTYVLLIGPRSTYLNFEPENIREETFFDWLTRVAADATLHLLNDKQIGMPKNEILIRVIRDLVQDARNVSVSTNYRKNEFPWFGYHPN